MHTVEAVADRADVRAPRRHASNAQGTTARVHAAWGGAGFLLGVIVWHFVGFWSFVAEIVYRGPDPTVTTAARDRAPTGAGKRALTLEGQSRIARAGEPDAATCTSLVLDRATGTTRLERCGTGAQPRLVETAARGDRLEIPGREPGWAVTVDADHERAD